MFRDQSAQNRIKGEQGMKSRTFWVLAILVIASMVFTACAAPTATAPAGEAAAPGGESATSAEDLTRPHPMLSDINVRHAIAHCIDRDALLQAVYPYVDAETLPTLRMDTFLPKTHWAYSGPYTDYEFSVEQGSALLEESGWVLPEGAAYREKDGETLQLTLTTTNSQFRQTWAAVVEQQLAACGIALIRQHTPASWWFGDTTGLARRDFELGAFAWVGQTDPAGRTLYACDQIPTPRNEWEGQNGMGWCNEVANQAVILATNTINQEDRVPFYDTLQQEFAKDMVSLPLFQRAEAEAWSLNLQGLVVDPTEYGTASGKDWSLADGGDTVVIGFSQEPASMFDLVESAAVQRQASQLGRGIYNTQYNYDYQAYLQDGLSTLESGLATNEMVTVAEGDMVYDAAGQPVTLTTGTEVIVDGETVAWDGASELQLPQLVVTYKWLPHTWSDGVPATVADFELAFRINCDPASGATTFTTCEAIQGVEYGTGEAIEYTVTYLPGVQDPNYMIAPFSISPSAASYPSHQVISDGRNLADVPAAEWATLPEIAEKPLSIAPFVITEWIKGQSMTLEANPYFFGGTPGLQRIVIVFVQDTTQLVAQLISGDVDYVEKATLAGGAEVQLVKDAAEQGQLNFEIIASPTWEHIDMNLFVKEQ
jgi:ABC-type transport system substrate-binding protein